MNRCKSFWIGNTEINFGIDLSDWVIGLRFSQPVADLPSFGIYILCFYLEAC